MSIVINGMPKSQLEILFGPQVYIRTSLSFIGLNTSFFLVRVLYSFNILVLRNSVLKTYSFITLTITERSLSGSRLPTTLNVHPAVLKPPLRSFIITAKAF